MLMAKKYKVLVPSQRQQLVPIAAKDKNLVPLPRDSKDP
jgi:hypothetical protein